MYNKPAGTIGLLGLGPGILYLGPAGATPTLDVGYVTASPVLSLKREQHEVRQGSPQTIVAAFAKQEDFMLEIRSIEWNMDTLLKALGDGATSVSAPNTILKSGGTPACTAYALRFVHKMPDGGTLTLDMWKVIGEGIVESTIEVDKPHEMKLKFKAIDPGTTDWGAAALTDGQKMIKIARTAP